MKLLYIVPNINNEGGVARVLSVKSNYLIENWGYEIHIATQNKGNTPLFYDFHPSIMYHDLLLKGNFWTFLKSYKEQLSALILTLKPDVIIVCDNGLKAFLLPYLYQFSVPTLLEIHSSLQISESKTTLLGGIKHKLFQFFKKNSAKKYPFQVVESIENSKEWGLKNAKVIPNPLWFEPKKTAILNSKIAIAVGRPTYEKGFDRLLVIWQKIVLQQPEWQLHIYGQKSETNSLEQLVIDLNIQNSVKLLAPIKNIEDKYQTASIYLMTSRYEAFGMVLIEAMATGLPCVAYDCPCGPRAIISNNIDGFLIENNNEDDYISSVLKLMDNENLRTQMSVDAQKTSEKYNIKPIMNTWNNYLKEFTKNKSNDNSKI